MSRNTSGLKRGGPGRPKGSLNKATLEIKDAARKLVEAPEYVMSLERRLTQGRAPHMETLLFHYAYGKPTETVDTPGIDNLAAALSRKVIFDVQPGPTKAA